MAAAVRLSRVRYDELDVHVLADARALARAAALEVTATVSGALADRRRARVMFASGNSQLDMLACLAGAGRVDWTRVAGFHIDEYVGMVRDHPASFRRYMRDRVVEPFGLGAFHELAGDAPDLAAEAGRYAALMRAAPVDLCCLGVGENGHLAFNDPPVADFDDPLDVKIVTLDDASRRQQVREGHFASLDEVPERALTVTVPALLRAGRVVVVVPEARKAEPARRALEGPVSPDCPASILRRVPHATLYLDADSASLLGRGT